MRTVETNGTVSADGRLSIRVPGDIPPGEHRVVVVIDEQPFTQGKQPLAEFPTLDVGPWPEQLSLSREDLYGDAGR